MFSISQSSSNQCYRYLFLCNLLSTGFSRLTNITPIFIKRCLFALFSNNPFIAQSKKFITTVIAHMR